jgi:hypothetical protein
MRRVAELELRVASSMGASPADQTAMELRIPELTAELHDLRLLQRGDTAMQAEIDACRAEIRALERDSTSLAIRTIGVPVPSTWGERWRLTLSCTLALGTLLAVATNLVLRVGDLGVLWLLALFGWIGVFTLDLKRHATARLRGGPSRLLAKPVTG